MKKTAVIFSYNDGELLLSSLRAALRGNVEEIILLYGGNDIPMEVEMISDRRLVKVHEEERKGKVKALNSILPLITGDIVFLISGDISFDPAIFDKCEERFDKGVGAISARVLPKGSKSLTGDIASLMWELHDFQLSFLSRLGMNVHGGEFLCVRGTLLWEMPEVINDDEYLCIRAASAGLRVLYLEEIEVNNTVPSNPFDLFQQRRRINFGHLEMMKDGNDPRVMDTLIRSNPRLFLEIFSSFLHEKRVKFVHLAGAIIIEFMVLVSSRIDLAAGKDHRKWAMVKRETSS
jgi:cellulose synthase/poly-beta-1,6-N-acetylglucosamine synthase-like glycosyltransferase